MKKLFLTSVAIFTLSSPAFATVDIAKNASDPGCTNSVLKTYTGPTDLEADYTANTINLNFYTDENTIYSTGTCTYDGGIELPEEDPTRTGYTFDGWQVRRAASHGGQQNEPSNPQQTSFDLSTLNASIDGIYAASHSLDDGSCSYYNPNTGELYTDCSDSHISSLSAGQWETGFSYGTIRGTSKCELTGETEEDCWEDEETGEEICDEYETADCHCQVTSFAEPNNNNYIPVASPSLVAYGSLATNDCTRNCAANCSSIVQYDDEPSFRAELFGQ